MQAVAHDVCTRSFVYLCFLFWFGLFSRVDGDAYRNVVSGELDVRGGRGGGEIKKIKKYPSYLGEGLFL